MRYGELYLVNSYLSRHTFSLPHSMVPAKVVHDWKTLLILGQPLYPDTGQRGEDEGGGEAESSSRLSQSTRSEPPTDVVRDTLLDETDFWQYRVCSDNHHIAISVISPRVYVSQNVQVDWVADELDVDLPEPHCPILTHIVYSLLDQVDPPQVSMDTHTSHVCSG